jgi:hypothetical protein
MSVLVCVYPRALVCLVLRVFARWPAPSQLVLRFRVRAGCVRGDEAGLFVFVCSPLVFLIVFSGPCLFGPLLLLAWSSCFSLPSELRDARTGSGLAIRVRELCMQAVCIFTAVSRISGSHGVDRDVCMWCPGLQT